MHIYTPLQVKEEVEYRIGNNECPIILYISKGPEHLSLSFEERNQPFDVEQIAGTFVNFMRDKDVYRDKKVDGVFITNDRYLTFRNTRLEWVET